MVSKITVRLKEFGEIAVLMGHMLRTDPGSPGLKQPHITWWKAPHWVRSTEKQ